MTSHDVVNRVRRVTGERRVGHAGTLDPAASGLLVVLVGPATRLEPYLSAASKAYLATIAFGEETDTDDAEGQVTKESAVPPEIFDRGSAQTILDSFLGDSMQMPPVYSAIKVEGKIAHRVARGGGEIKLQERPVTVGRAALQSVDSVALTWDVDFEVSKGTYVRALARDIGRAVGSSAHLSGLRRTASGPNRIGNAVTLAEFESVSTPSDAARFFVDPVSAVELSARELPGDSITDGRPLRGLATFGDPEGTRYAITSGEGLVALYRSCGPDLVADVVFATPVRRPV